MTPNPYEGARGGVCMDCKWPNASKVARACPCHGRRVLHWLPMEHDEALKEARELQLAGVPFSDPRYYEAPHRCHCWFGGKCVECGAAWPPATQAHAPGA